MPSRSLYRSRRAVTDPSLPRRKPITASKSSRSRRAVTAPIPSRRRTTSRNRSAHRRRMSIVHREMSQKRRDQEFVRLVNQSDIMKELVAQVTVAVSRGQIELDDDTRPDMLPFIILENAYEALYSNRDITAHEYNILINALNRQMHRKLSGDKTPPRPRQPPA